MSLLKDQRFYELCQILQVQGQVASDPDRKVIEKAFRKLALKTHPDKGGDPVKFRQINDAYNKLIAHTERLERLEHEAELRATSVIIEISKQSLPKWWEKLKAQYGPPKSSDVKNTIFSGPYKQYKGRGKLTGPITLILYEDPEDKIPKIMCKCQNYMAWIQEQKLPLHLHVDRNKKIAFDQWRIMSLAEYHFVNVDPTSSARHDWKSQDTPRTRRDTQKEREEKERKQREKEELERKEREKKEEEERQRKAEEEAEKKRKEKEQFESKPWWHQYANKYQGFNMGETTPPPEDFGSSREDPFPKVFNITSNSFTVGGLSSADRKNESRPFVNGDLPASNDETKPEPERSKVPENSTVDASTDLLGEALTNGDAAPDQFSDAIFNQTEKSECGNSRSETPKKEFTKPRRKKPSKTKVPETLTKDEEMRPPQAAPEAPDEVTNYLSTGKAERTSEQVNPVQMETEVEPEKILEPQDIDIELIVTTAAEHVETVVSDSVQPVEAEIVDVTHPAVVKEPCPVLVEVTNTLSDVNPSVSEVSSEPNKPARVVSEDELSKKDIGKIADKLSAKSKIKKAKAKKSVPKKIPTEPEACSEIPAATDKENILTESHLMDDSGIKTRKRPLEEATADWTTEGQTLSLFKCCVTILLALVVATLAFYCLN